MRRSKCVWACIHVHQPHCMAVTLRVHQPRVVFGCVMVDTQRLKQSCKQTALFLAQIMTHQVRQRCTDEGAGSFACTTSGSDPHTIGVSARCAALTLQNFCAHLQDVAQMAPSASCLKSLAEIISLAQNILMLTRGRVAECTGRYCCSAAAQVRPVPERGCGHQEQVLPLQEGLLL